MWYSSLALASVFDHDLGRVLDPAGHPLTAAGVGAPTVAWDPDDELFVLFFETQVDASVAAPCSNGRWGIGAASSPDGVTWTVWDDLVVAPTPGTPYACVAAHPAVVYDGGVFHLWFKAEEGSTLPRSPAAAWEADNYTGVGYATVDVRLDDKTADIAALDAQIAGLEADRDQAVLDYRDELVQYRTDLQAQADEFACQAGAPLCAPCGAVTLSFTASPLQTRSRSRSFCQDFGFVVPSNVSLTLPAGYLGIATSTLAWDGGSCTRTRIGYIVGSTSSYSCTVAPGTSVTTRSVSLTLSNLGTGTVSTNTTLNATNVGAQTFTGALLSDLASLITLASVPSWASVDAALPGWITALDGMFTWLDTPPVTPDEAFLRTETAAVRDDAVALQAALDGFALDLAALEAERDALLAYVPGVDATIAPGLALPLPQKFGYPAVAKLDGEWVMLVQKYPDLYRAVGAAPDAFVLEPTPVIEAGAVSWANTEVYEPSLVCGDGPFPYDAWLAGKTVVGGLLQSAGLSDAVSDDGLTWLLNTVADLTFTDPNLHRHFDVIGDDAGALRMYTVTRVNGVNELHLLATEPDWTPSATRNRVCAP